VIDFIGLLTVAITVEAVFESLPPATKTMGYSDKL
jgi:hypothetical protein